MPVLAGHKSNIRPKGVGGFRDVPTKASFKAEESSMRRAVVGGGRVVVVAGERRTRGNRWARNARNLSR
jgi:hypothetical protein